MLMVVCSLIVLMLANRYSAFLTNTWSLMSAETELIRLLLLVPLEQSELMRRHASLFNASQDNRK